MKRLAIYCFLLMLLQNGESVQAAGEISFRVEMLPWEEVDVLLPKYMKFTVMDVETGRRFRVQRRAGSRHADVQPLTTRDTKIMKEIYGGGWSWRRRAIIIIHNDQWIAASMHGMPHGAGALKNNFPGHFCIHFLGSTTHRTNSMDLSHKLMVLKAAGELKGYFAAADPYEVVQGYLAGLKQQDPQITSLVSLQELRWKKILGQIVNVRLSSMSMLPPEDLTTEIYLDIPVEVDWVLQGLGAKTIRSKIHLVRFSPYEPWMVDTVRFLRENFIKMPKGKYTSVSGVFRYRGVLFMV